MIDGDYYYKRTQNAFDFNVLLSTSVVFPIAWQRSKIDGIGGRINLTNYKGLTAFVVAGHTRARYFPPESGGLFFNSDLPAGVFRIDHDQKFQLTALGQYQVRTLEAARTHTLPSLGATTADWWPAQFLISIPRWLLRVTSRLR